MAEETKPIKTERIDNPDGTYTVKEVYDRPNFDCYLSDIEIFDSNDRMLSGTYYNDKNFNTLIFSETREYTENDNYYQIDMYEKTQGYGYIVAKCLCNKNDKPIEVWFYEDKECDKLLIYETREYLENDITYVRSIDYKNSNADETYLDKENRKIKEFYYNDIEFKEIVQKHESKYNEDGSYTLKSVNIFSNKDNDLCRSAISYLNNKGQLIEAKSFYDEDFTKYHSLQIYEYRKNSSYTVKTTYDKCDENGWKSSIEKYDKDHNLLYGEYYQDNDFKTIGQKTIRKYYKNGNYRDIKRRTVADNNGWVVINELYNKDYNFLSGYYETSSEVPNQIILRETWKYNNDGTHERYCSYIKQAKDKDYLSYIEKDRSNDEYISSRFYKDKHFRKLYYSCNKETISENHYIDRIIEDNVVNGEHFKSRTFESISDKQTEIEKYYRNNDYTGLISSSYKHINSNGNTERQIVYENDQGGWHSTVFERDKQGNVVKQIWYIDKDMQQPYCEQLLVEYKDKNNYAYKIIYYDNSDTKEYYTATKQFYIEYYSNNKVCKALCYKDKEFTQLQATETYEYLSKGKSIKRVVFEEPYKDMQSIVEYRNKDNYSTYCLGYIDRNFETLFRRTWIKYTKNYSIRLRIYDKMQDGFNTEIEKYDKDKKLIYKKQYKFKGILAHILFWLAR